uniref:Uncharacterized protein AnMKRN1 n=1 Tax=Mus musculus TaxID=10090 RepID=Q65Z89_MOUSE|nr:hypothetical protein [Mus musculus]BAD51437.1 hypothetical protein [Mus musculus]
MVLVLAILAIKGPHARTNFCLWLVAHVQGTVRIPADGSAQVGLAADILESHQCEDLSITMAASSRPAQAK